MTPEERKLAEAALSELAHAVVALESAGIFGPGGVLIDDKMGGRWVLRPAASPPKLLEMTYRDLADGARKGYALGWLASQLEARWAPFPDLPLSDILKTERPDRIAYLAGELAQVGITGLLPPPEAPEVPDGD